MLIIVFRDIFIFAKYIYIHTYAFRIIDLVSHTTYIVCVLILYKSGRTYSLKSTPSDRLFEKLFKAILFTLQSFCRKSAERKSPKKYFWYFVLMSGLRVEPWFYGYFQQLMKKSCSCWTLWSKFLKPVRNALRKYSFSKCRIKMFVNEIVKEGKR